MPDLPEIPWTERTIDGQRYHIAEAEHAGAVIEVRPTGVALEVWAYASANQIHYEELASMEQAQRVGERIIREEGRDTGELISGNPN